MNCHEFAGVVHENPRIGSDGESEEASGASDEVTSPVKLRPKNRRLSEVFHIQIEFINYFHCLNELSSSEIAVTSE